MKKFIIIFLFLLTNCTSNIDESFIKEHNKELFSIFNDLIKSNFDTVSAEGKGEIAEKIRKLGIDKVNIKYKPDMWDYIRADSLVHFIVEDHGIWEPTKIIIFDFAQTPRKFGNAEVIGASYYRKQVLDRWYLESIGFD
ncbi:MAG: hypothetical protein NVV82_15840 [Sporocytophaga sp.]|nr:hypothetical protein [Sporocytophaga sp.]